MEIEELFKDWTPAIDREIAKVAPKKHKIRNLYDAMWYHYGTGGKRFRPVLGILVAKALNCKIEKILPYVAAIEIFHQFTLVHDDIEDGDRFRRGRPTVWVRYGVPHAINIGDAMLITSYKSALRLRKVGVKEKTIQELLELLTRAYLAIAEGQALDMNLRLNKNPSEKQFMEMIRKKTGFLIGASIAGSALIAGAPRRIRKALQNYGNNLGPAFQIKDDVLNLTAGKAYGKEIGGDIKEGKRTLMVVHLLKNCKKQERKRVLHILDKPREKTSRKEVRFVIHLMKNYGSIDYARRKARMLARTAITALNPLKKSEAKDVLIGLANYLASERKR